MLKNICVFIILGLIFGNFNFILSNEKTKKEINVLKNGLKKSFKEIGLNENLVKENYEDQIDLIVKNSNITRKSINKYLKRKILLKQKVDLMSYSTLVAIYQQDQIFIDKSELLKLEKISNCLS